jgi:4-carboxymuconolactone decarboxylase
MKGNVVRITIVTLLAAGLCSMAAPQPPPKGKHLSEPRIPPLTKDQWTEEQRKVLERFYTEGRLYNVQGTFAQNWDAYKNYYVWATYIIGNASTLPPRERELLILRTGWLCHSEYEWGQHVLVGKAAGLTDAEIARIKEGPEAPGWHPFDASLLRAADELHESAFITDATWASLSRRYSTKQLMDTVFTVGQYTMVSMALNTFGVQLDNGVNGF